MTLRSRQVLKLSGLGLAIGLVLATLFVHRSTSDWIRNKIQSDVTAACPKCQLKLGAVSFSWISQELQIQNIEFIGDPNDNTVIAVSAESLSIKVNLASWKSDALELNAVVVSQAKVRVSETSQGPPGIHAKFPQPGHATAWLPPLRIGSVNVLESEFIYALKVSKKTALIRIQNIDASMGSMVTRADLLTPPLSDKDALIHLELVGLIEQTGRLEMNIDFEPFAQNNHDLVEIKIRDQKLIGLNGFFFIEDGLKLEGTLHYGLAKFHLASGKLTGTLRTDYQDLSMKFHSDPRHGLFKTLIARLVAQSFTKTRPKNKKDRAEVLVMEQRKPFQPITQFILQGLKSGTNLMLRN